MAPGAREECLRRFEILRRARHSQAGGFATEKPRGGVCHGARERSHLEGGGGAEKWAQDLGGHRPHELRHKRSERPRLSMRCRSVGVVTRPPGTGRWMRWRDLI